VISRRTFLTGLALLPFGRPRRRALYPSPQLYPSRTLYPSGG
jgi:hypothetical protein